MTTTPSTRATGVRADLLELRQSVKDAFGRAVQRLRPSQEQTRQRSASAREPDPPSPASTPLLARASMDSAYAHAAAASAGAGRGAGAGASAEEPEFAGVMTEIAEDEDRMIAFVQLSNAKKEFFLMTDFGLAILSTLNTRELNFIHTLPEETFEIFAQDFNIPLLRLCMGHPETFRQNLTEAQGSALKLLIAHELNPVTAHRQLQEVMTPQGQGYLNSEFFTQSKPNCSMLKSPEPIIDVYTWSGNKLQIRGTLVKLFEEDAESIDSLLDKLNGLGRPSLRERNQVELMRARMLSIAQTLEKHDLGEEMLEQVRLLLIEASQKCLDRSSAYLTDIQGLISVYLVKDKYKLAVIVNAYKLACIQEVTEEQGNDEALEDYLAAAIDLRKPMGIKLPMRKMCYPGEAQNEPIDLLFPAVLAQSNAEGLIDFVAQHAAFKSWHAAAHKALIAEHRARLDARDDEINDFDDELAAELFLEQKAFPDSCRRIIKTIWLYSRHRS